MPIFSKKSKNVLFIHIPKSAGSSIERIGRDLGWTESFSIRGKSLDQISYCRASYQHLHADVLEYLFDLEDFESVFTVVRHPFERLKSEYYWQLQQGLTSLPAANWINHTFDSYLSNEFLFDNHIRPQVEFIPELEKMKVFKLEEGGVKSAEKIFLDLGGSKKFSLFDMVFGNTVRQEKKSIKKNEVERAFQNNKKVIYDFYIDDYKRFNYT